MKHLYILSALLFTGTCLSAQTIKVYKGEKGVTYTKPDSIVFVNSGGAEYDPEASKEDASLYRITPGTGLAAYTTETNLAGNLYKLLCVSDIENAIGLNNVEITPEQYEEVKTLTETIISGKTKTLDKMNAIYSWVHSNVSYMTEYPEYVEGVDPNSAYKVFKNRKAVCQGYANLTNVMMHCAGIPAVNANGFLENYGGHAWVYVLCDDSWKVIDPTNSGSTVYSAVSTSTYNSKLIPWEFDMTLMEDNNCSYEFKEKMFNVKSVNSSDSPIYSLPYSVRGYRLQCFDPQSGISDNIREIYLHKYIQSIGDYAEGLNQNGKNLYNVYVEDANTNLCDYDGCVYTKVSSKPGQLLYIPGAKKEVTIAPIATIEKNTICNNESLEKVTFDATSLTFEDYAIEDCPNVKEIYISSSATYSENAFYGVSKDCKIIKY